MACDHFPTLSITLAAPPISLNALAPQDPSPPEAHVECRVYGRISACQPHSIRVAAKTGRRNYDLALIIRESPEINEPRRSTASELSFHNPLEGLPAPQGIH